MCARLLTSGEGELHATAHWRSRWLEERRGSALRAARRNCYRVAFSRTLPPGDSGVRCARRNHLKDDVLVVRESNEEDNPAWHPSRKSCLLRKPRSNQRSLDQGGRERDG